MATKPQCFAYSGEGMRCEKSAGHAGKHYINFSWDDSECYIPMPAPAKPLSPTSYLSPIRETRGEDTPVSSVTEHGFEIKQAQPAPQEDTRCIACSHRHRSGECKCGCHEHIG